MNLPPQYLPLVTPIHIQISSISSSSSKTQLRSVLLFASSFVHSSPLCRHKLKCLSSSRSGGEFPQPVLLTVSTSVLNILFCSGMSMFSPTSLAMLKGTDWDELPFFAFYIHIQLNVSKNKPKPPNIQNLWFYKSKWGLRKDQYKVKERVWFFACLLAF